MILTCHTLCCTLQGMPARMGETLQSVQEVWLRLDAGENKRKSLLFKRISSAEQVNAQNHKIGKRVSSVVLGVCQAIWSWYCYIRGGLVHISM